MFRKKGAVSIDKIIGKMRGISYRLGMSRAKPMEVKELEKELGAEIGASFGVVDAPKGYEFPHQQEKIQEDLREIQRRKDDAISKYRRLQL